MLSKLLLDGLNKAHLKYEDIQPLIDEVASHKNIQVEVIGKSFEQRDIHLISLGQGRTTIFIWTQMHGDECTATASVFDLISLLCSDDAALVNWELTYRIHIIPMLNPDGAERCIRFNAQGIDINRDGRELQSPEAKILSETFDKIQPVIALNMHDQSPYYQTGETGNPSTIAFLAPAYDQDENINAARRMAMALINIMRNKLEAHIPQCVARYVDAYSPRAFGDNLAARGASTILIESGAARKDPNRQSTRQMNTIAILEVIKNYPQLALEESLDKHVDGYFQIPQNKKESISSLVVRNVQFDTTPDFKVSISIKQSTRWSNEYYIDAIGDLHIQAGLEEFDADGLTFERGKVHCVDEAESMSDELLFDYLRKGFLFFEDKKGLLQNNSSHALVCIDGLHEKQTLQVKQPAYFLLRKKTQIVAAILNGKLVVLD